jgi:hypothetical protein
MVGFFYLAQCGDEPTAVIATMSSLRETLRAGSRGSPALVPGEPTGAFPGRDRHVVLPDWVLPMGRAGRQPK